ncbi:hypothetical protein B0H19DRAFT_1079757 [Mycena capillaripes]|nr:hypothetical protein B0H19DRAFT_1079757 [Mycena capillaripes]
MVFVPQLIDLPEIRIMKVKCKGPRSPYQLRGTTVDAGVAYRWEFGPAQVPSFLRTTAINGGSPITCPNSRYRKMTLARWIKALARPWDGLYPNAMRNCLTIASSCHDVNRQLTVTYGAVSEVDDSALATTAISRPLPRPFPQTKRITTQRVYFTMRQMSVLLQRIISPFFSTDRLRPIANFVSRDIASGIAIRMNRSSAHSTQLGV